jgi:ABC-2 type transport system permease protein
MTATTMPVQRRLPKFGGFSIGMIGLEFRRMLRNRRTVVFTFVMPAVLLLLFGKQKGTIDGAPGLNITGYVMVSMAVYGAMLATTSGGAMVSVERAAGWSRQLRLTPLKPIAYVAVKLVLAMSIGLISVLVANVVGYFIGAKLPGAGVWLACAALAWICALVFAAFGLFMGYLLPSENVMQILGPVLAVLSFAGGLFVPVDSFGHVFATIAKFTPVYGVGELARGPLTHDGNLWLAALNVIVWTALFGAGAMWRFRRDTARV